MIASLTADGLACVRGERRLFDSLSFTVKAGQALSVEGPNGAGKTSLLRMIAGFLAPAAGTLTLTDSGTSITDAEERGRFIGWLGHQDGLKPQFTVSEQLHFYRQLYAGAARAGEEDVLDQVGLTRQRDLPCRYLSAGQKRRLALARLVICGRPLWLLDEPFAALDTAGQALVAHLMTMHCGAGGIVIAATHDPLGLGNEILRLGDESLTL
jgi:heme exporter protein A